MLILKSHDKSYKKSYKSIVRYLPINDSVDKKHDKIKLRYDNGHSPKDKIMLFAGFITPLPYNYYRLKKWGHGCH